MPRESSQPVVLTIAGSDSGGNAGIQADLRALHAFGVHGCTALTALTAQNPRGVSGVLAMSPEFLARQLDAVFDAYTVAAIKTGMLATAELIEVAAERLLARRGRAPCVVDPVMVATSGARLLESPAVAVLKARLLPLATLMTPNLPEVEALLERPINSLDEAAEAARELHGRFGCAVLVKGGHEVVQRATDLLFDGTRLWRLTTPVVAAPLSTHGTGCALSAAIAAALAGGCALTEAVASAKGYLYAAIRDGRRVGPDAAVMGMPACFSRQDVHLEVW